MMHNNEMKIDFDSRSENEAFARVVVAAFAAQLDPTLEEISDIKTAVSEAVTNAIIHGYENKEGKVHITCRLYDTEVYIEVIDSGTGIEDIEQAREPLYTSKPELERSGMGFTVMESFMDEVFVESTPNNGTKIIMKKKIQSRIEE
ncbi:stage II sporulation protein AB (anti-sigma F factor) [Natranaerovirga pectinivora]|uniref:Anti-sigma F factor n=1 Tax=Natranaerovirga pectinivora TaxID=682400 RepID=A0A4R3MPT0_9FIRM|nr:anti-sigma F factor [Natranaerovirga pectinivora]TCT14285.1 stage II sporulation protein AB (anti-sigma F factor) [Natranaerovirga pectinivora]